MNGAREEIPWSWFDSKTLGAADTEATLFQDPRGAASKTGYDTNMDVSGQLQQPSEFDCYALRVGVLPDTGDDLVIALMKGYLRFTVGNKVYYTCPLSVMTSGFGLAIHQHLAGAGTVNYGSFGIPDGRNVHILSIPIKITIGMHFDVKLAWAAAPTAVKVYGFLDGVLRRARQ